MSDILSKLSAYFQKPLTRKIIEFILLISITLVFFIYSYQRNYLPLIGAFMAVLFLVIIILIIIFGPKKELNYEFFKNFLSLFNVKKQYQINLKYLAVLFPGLASLLAFIFSLFVNYQPIFQLKDLAVLGISIFQKIFLIYFFYFTGIIVVSAWGRKILALFKIKFTSNLELFLFSIGAGLIPCMLGVYFLAWLGWLYTGTVSIMILFFILISLKEIKCVLKELNVTKIKLSFENKFPALKTLVFVLLFFLLTINFITLFKPAPTDADSLNVYFNAPSLYVNYHQLLPLGHTPHANMGQNTEMLYANILSLANSEYLVHFSLLFFIFCLIGFYLLAQKFINEKYALLAVFVLYFIPWNFYYIHTNKVEFLLAFYSLLITYLFISWHKNSDSRYLYLLGIFSGIALGIKYTAGLLIALIYAWLFILLLKKYKNTIKAAKIIVLTGLLAIVSFAPWAIKNLIYFNTAFYPYQIFSFEKKVKTNIYECNDFFKKERGSEILFLKHGTDAKNDNVFEKIIKVSWRQSLGVKTVNILSSNFGFIPLLFFPFILLFVRKKNSIILSLITLIYFSAWFLSPLGIRPWYAFFGFMLIYFLLPNLLLNNKKILYLYILFSLMIALPHIIYLNNFKYLAGLETREGYLTRNIDYYQAAKFINNLNLKQNEKILILQNNIAAFINKNDKLINLDFYLENTGCNFYNKNKNYFQILKQASVKYILFSDQRNNYYYSWLTNKKTSLNSYLINYQGKIPSIYEDMQKLTQLLPHHAGIVYQDKFYTLYELK